jgi:short-subunit dehydrogenase
LIYSKDLNKINKMYKWNGRVAIITGASTAIGQSIVRALVEQGLTVCAIAKKTGVAKLDVSEKIYFKRIKTFIKCKKIILKLEI